MTSQNATVGIALLAITMAFFLSGCKGPVDDPQGPGNEADLLTLALGNLAVPGVPTRITMAAWNNEERFLEAIEEEKHTKIVPIPSGFNLSGAAITVTASKNAAAEYAVTADFYERPAAFVSIGTAAASLDFDSFLYIKITSEDKSAIQYYRFYIQDGENASVKGITMGKSSITLTIHSSEQLTWTVSPFNAANKAVNWSSSDNSVAEVSPGGVVTAVNFSSGGSSAYTAPATGTAVITATTADGGHTASVTVTTTTEPQVSMTDLPPLKDQFADYFLIGNIYRNTSDVSGSGTDAEIANAGLARHFNAVTAENLMKPSDMISGRDAATGELTWNANNRTAADNLVSAAENAGMKVIGHTLLWHSQNPNWVWNQIAGRNGAIVSGMTKEKAIEIMRDYINEVAGRWAGRIYSWDVLNEAFPDNAGGSADWKDAIRKNAQGEGQDANPWYIAIGPDFVYEGFLAARLADPRAILYYNDYNTDQANRARLIRDMVRDVNERYLSGTDKPAGEDPARLLIEGIGMQEHHNTGVTAASIRATIDLFRPLGVILSVTELDVLAQTYQQYSSNSTPTNDGIMTQARLYGEYMQLYLENADIIERVSLWGILDNQSWRSRGRPLLFDNNGRAKPSYYRFVGALNQHN